MSMGKKKPKRPPGTTPRPGRWEWPPDVFWISPNGAVIEVIGHLTALQARPETYGLPAAPQTRAEIDVAFSDLFMLGWVRGRFADDTFHFQMGRPRGTPMGNAYYLALKFAEQMGRVDIDFADPAYARMAMALSAKDFLAQRFPASWGFNPKGE